MESGCGMMGAEQELRGEKMKDKKDDVQGKTRMVNEEEFVSGSETQRLRTMFPGRTDAEYVRINRNFLKDAEPFSLSRLMNDMKKAPENLLTGFRAFDDSFCLPGGAITLVAGGPKQGKSIFMMNLMLNLARRYRGKHFIYYTYEEKKKDIEMKLINMLGEKPFEIVPASQSHQGPEPADMKTNLDFWKHTLGTLQEAELLKFAVADEAYSGLKNFLDMADRFHIVDQNYSVSRLIESIKLFNGPFRIGGVFVDFIQKVQPGQGLENLSMEDRMLNVSSSLKQFALQMNFPLMIGVQVRQAEMNPLDRERFSDEFIMDLKGLEQDARLIIQLQQPADNLDAIIARMLANREGFRAEARFKFDRSLLKISDPD